MIDDILNLYEHQSSINPNMPMRGILYMADVYNSTNRPQSEAPPEFPLMRYDSKGALLFGTYEIEELRCDTNKGSAQIYKEQMIW